MHPASNQPDQTPEERLNAAQQQLAAMIESGRVLGINGLQIPPHAETLASVNALTLMLIDQGVINETEFVDRKTMQMAELIEGMVAQLAEVKQNLASKLLLAHAQQPSGLV